MLHVCVRCSAGQGYIVVEKGGPTHSFDAGNDDGRVTKAYRVEFSPNLIREPGIQYG